MPEELSVSPSEKADSNSVQPYPPLNILYQDEHIVAIDKPPGLLVHRSPIDRHETRFAVQTLRDQLNKHVFPAHRLDRPTSGVLLFSFDSKTAVTIKLPINISARSRHLSKPQRYTKV